MITLHLADRSKETPEIREYLDKVQHLIWEEMLNTFNRKSGVVQADWYRAARMGASEYRPFPDTAEYFVKINPADGREALMLRTPAGYVALQDKQWVVRDADDNYYPVSESMFSLLYEPMPQVTSTLSPEPHQYGRSPSVDAVRDTSELQKDAHSGPGAPDAQASRKP